MMKEWKEKSVIIGSDLLYYFELPGICMEFWLSRKPMRGRRLDSMGIRPGLMRVKAPLSEYSCVITSLHHHYVTSHEKTQSICAVNFPALIRPSHFREEMEKMRSRWETYA